MIENQSFAEAEKCLKNRAFKHPLEPEPFALLSEIWRLTGRLDAAQAAERRFKQLEQIDSNFKPAKMADQYMAVVSNAANTADLIEWDDFSFAGLRVSRHRGQICLVGSSLDGRAFLKLEIVRPEVPGRSLRDETEMVRLLSKHSCVSCPRLLQSGTIKKEELNDSILKPLGDLDIEDQSQPEGYYFQITEYARADRGGFSLSDIVLSLLEQQALGVYQNCVSLECIRFDSLLGICRFSDYRNALLLEDSIRDLPPRDYLQWCLEKEDQRLARGGLNSFFAGREAEINQLFDGEKFLLVRSRLFGRQRIADMPDAFIQDVREDGCYLNGTIRVDDRAASLDGFSIEENERILDLGCGAGGLSRYFARRGGLVTAVDCDTQLVEQTRLLANLAKLKVDADTCDLEFDFPQGTFDTVLALGILPNVSNPKNLADRIKNTDCQRVIVECGINEINYRWQGSEFHKVHVAWAFSHSQDLKDYLQFLFQGFSLRELKRTSDKRFLFALTRECGKYDSPAEAS